MLPGSAEPLKFFASTRSSRTTLHSSSSSRFSCFHRLPETALAATPRPELPAACLDLPAPFFGSKCSTRSKAETSGSVACPWPARSRVTILSAMLFKIFVSASRSSPPGPLPTLVANRYASCCGWFSSRTEMSRAFLQASRSAGSARVDWPQTNNSRSSRKGSGASKPLRLCSAVAAAMPAALSAAKAPVAMPFESQKARSCTRL
mmetsp:Transcript_19911/g.43234  ORF Transcript_19911/g.43234 Transcript_19911/m.43234 type:complete len:205 (-) Transcript_19911:3183-3797(-)